MDERESLVHPHAPKDSFAIWWRTMWTAVEGKNGAKSNVVYPLVLKLWQLKIPYQWRFSWQNQFYMESFPFSQV